MEPYWSPNNARTLTTGDRYLFVVATSGVWDEEKVFRLLESRGWEVVSMGAPPAEMLTTIQALQKRLSPEPTALPRAWRVIAVWRGASGTVLPDRDPVNSVLYGPIVVWFQPTGPSLPEKPASSSMSFGARFLLVTIGAGVLVGGTVLVVRRLDPRTALAENPRKKKEDEDVCWGPEAHKHKRKCRVDRPLCRWRRRDRGICHCPAFHFPHRDGSCTPIIKKWQNRLTGT
jgi:hypothetical protein